MDWIHELVISSTPFRQRPNEFYIDYCELDIPDNVDICYILYHFQDDYMDALPIQILTDKYEADREFAYRMLEQLDELDEALENMKTDERPQYYYGIVLSIIQVIETNDRVRTSTIYEVFRHGLNYPNKGSRWFLHQLQRGLDFD